MTALAEKLREKIRSRTARTGVVGLGYVGLPLAVELGKAGFHATGIDLDARKVQAIKDGRSYIPDVTTMALGLMALIALGMLSRRRGVSALAERAARGRLFGVLKRG